MNSKAKAVLQAEIVFSEQRIAEVIEDIKEIQSRLEKRYALLERLKAEIHDLKDALGEGT